MLIVVAGCKRSETSRHAFAEHTANAVGGAGGGGAYGNGVGGLGGKKDVDIGISNDNAVVM
ncbi:MAG: hypothetical protein JST54_35285, partial [Deltaproteobacteria bacterium]|nr:hypothetical protein [Deltaproteobacteria bacterium]